MDVNGVVQNSIKINVSSSDLNISQYTNVGSEVAVPQVQKVQNESTVDNNAKNEEYTKNELDKALKKINGFLEDESTHAEYSVHKDFGTIMIKIVDDNTKQVILELPPEKVLDMVAFLCKQVGLLDKRA